MLAQQLAFSVGSGAGGAREQRRGRRRPLPGRTRRARSRRRAARLVEDDTGHRVLIYATESGVKNLTRWPGWQAIPHQILRPQRHNQRRLPRRLGARQAVSHLRDRAALPGADQGFQYRHGAPENARRARRAGRVPLGSPRDPHVDPELLPRGAAAVHAPRRLRRQQRSSAHVLCRNGEQIAMAAAQKTVPQLVLERCRASVTPSQARC